MRYCQEHLWFRRQRDGVAVGVTEKISRILTWVNRVDVAEVGARLAAGEQLAAIDSQKALIELASPVPLEVVAVNGEVLRDPMLVRTDPRGQGWLARVALGEDAWRELLDEVGYEELNASS